jgi:hypothetical protein
MFGSSNCLGQSASLYVSSWNSGSYGHVICDGLQDRKPEAWFLGFLLELIKQVHEPAEGTVSKVMRSLYLHGPSEQHGHNVAGAYHRETRLTEQYVRSGYGPVAGSANCGRLPRKELAWKTNSLRSCLLMWSSALRHSKQPALIQAYLTRMMTWASMQLRKTVFSTVNSSLARH